ncbi:hypothetical protein BH18THE1_BH18THE1_12930 [soil metagenome]
MANKAHRTEVFTESQRFVFDSRRCQDSINARMQEERAYFKAIRNIQIFDIMRVLHASGCYVLPNKSILEGLNFGNISKVFTTEPLFYDIIHERKFKKLFGFYGYNILRILRSQRNDDCL